MLNCEPRLQYDDYVAVYMAGVDPSSTAPIKFKWAVQVASHMEEGKGRHRCAQLACMHARASHGRLGTAHAIWRRLPCSILGGDVEWVGPLAHA